MSEVLEHRTRWSEVADAVEELANHVDDTAVRLPCERSIADGEWVRFAVQLADGTSVLEGVGRAQGRQNGRLTLSLLQFDEKNEIMYERVLLARQGGEVTGSQPILPKEEEAPPLPVFDSIPPPSNPKPSAPPPPKRPIAAPSRPLSPRPQPPRAQPLRAQPPTPEPHARRKRKPLKVPVDPAGATEMAPHDTVISAPSELVRIPADPGTLQLEVPRNLVDRARALAPTLPREVVDPARSRRSPEAAVLQAALRLGLASLAAIADVDDDL
ncbi:MAG: hypothetical protein VYE22_13430 [Myxococcota bacterium]|nr:hypothetical protein [Myxococcota bacterium]